MTPDTSPPADGGPVFTQAGHARSFSDDIELLVGLWEEARFARLPRDAPNELKELVEDIDNPTRVYAIHRAARRHNFQSLVQRFIVQLRDGCGNQSCKTPMCFTFRKKLSGRAPIRRYNTTSARTLAIYLATQDNPEKALCGGIKQPKTPPAIVNSLIFRPTARDDRASLKGETSSPLAVPRNGSESRNGPHPNSPGPRSGTPDDGNGSPLKPEAKRSPGAEQRKQPRDPGFTITEQSTSKDHRSFGANLFSTVAFKMLEWLTLPAIEEMTKKAQLVRGDCDDTEANSTAPTAAPVPDKPNGKPESSTGREPSPLSNALNGTAHQRTVPDQNGILCRGKEEKEGGDVKQNPQPQASPPVPMQRRNSKTKVRTTSSSKPKRKVSVDSLVADSLADDKIPSTLRSPLANGCHPERNGRGIKTTSSTLSRPISQLSSAGYFDHVSLEKMPAPKTADSKPRVGPSQLDGARSRSAGSSGPSEPGTMGTPSDRSSSRSPGLVGDEDTESEEDDLCPQALPTLDVRIVEFICDIIQADGTAEKHTLEPPTIKSFHIPGCQDKSLKRRSHAAHAASTNLKFEWRLFVEQTLFYVLSDPRRIIGSFHFYDSQTLWYCMLRLTRIAPSLVFDSLWLAAGSLFAPPKSLRTLRSPTTTPFPQRQGVLSDAEAGRLLSICLHALVAAAPLVKDPERLAEMSQIRSHGLTFGETGSLPNAPRELCLQYEDAFTNDLVLRLARRLFAAIVARRCFRELAEINAVDSDVQIQDLLSPLFSQLNFASADTVYVLDFSVKDRAAHEHRVPFLLLDWARAVMFHEWNGTAEVPGDGPFGGALALIEAIYKKRHDLMLDETFFSCEYFAERLDLMAVPVSWLSHNSTRQKAHLLDFPFLFTPDTLVSYFRAINLSRMTRSYEDASSLQEGVEIMAHRTSLNTNYIEILFDRMRPAIDRYLVLEIKRERVIQDTFDQLWRRQTRELLRPLKIRLGEQDGEFGFDLGGVQQEFFRLACAEALDPDHGIFTIDKKTRMAWFMPMSIEPIWKFQLVGLLFSLAVFNGLTLPITFPKALYRKLLGKPVTETYHIADGWPDIASGLDKLLDWDERDGSVEDVFCLTYSYSTKVYGQRITRAMEPFYLSKWPQFPSSATGPSPSASNPDPDSLPMVTSDNRAKYVSDYIRYLTDVTVSRQFRAFCDGFHACLHPKALSLLTPALLQSVVEGVQEINIRELQSYTRYIDWDANHPTVKDFWSIVSSYDDNMKRKLLEFVTASDRVPVGGMKNMQFTVQRNGVEVGENGRLPTSYTCYGTLLLPVYTGGDVKKGEKSARGVLRERLGMALENSKGFGNM